LDNDSVVAEMVGGEWNEGEGNTIELQGCLKVSLNNSRIDVHLCYVYYLCTIKKWSNNTNLPGFLII